MTRPRFSIVIPTRMRHETLPFTLKTCLDQTFGDYEVVVFDNASLPATKHAVEALVTDKIRYLRSEESLPMTASWTRALEASRGEWILFLGDDDGLFPWSLEELDRLTRMHDTRSIRWEMAVYTWPCVAVEDQKNRLQLPLERKVRIVSSEQRLGAMLRSPQSAPIPLPYHGLYHRSLFADAAATGAVFDGPCPDTFSGVLMAAITHHFLEVSVPMSIVGVSGKSNGLQGVIEDGSGATYRDFVQLNKLAGLRYHSQLPQLPLMPVIIMDGLLRVRDRLGARGPQWNITAQQIARHCWDGLWQSGSVRDQLFDEILQVLPEQASREAFRNECRGTSIRATRPSAVLPLGTYPTHVVLDAKNLRINNIADASQCAAKLLRKNLHLEYTDVNNPFVTQLRRDLVLMGYDLTKLKPGRKRKLLGWASRKLSSLSRRLPLLKRKSA